MINYFVDFEKNERHFPETYDKYKKIKRNTPESPLNVNEIYSSAVESSSSSSSLRSTSTSKEGFTPFDQKNPMIIREDPKYGGKCLKSTTPFDRIWNQATTPLSRDFFSDDTIKFIQHYISASLRENYDLPLGLQPRDGIVEYMIIMYNNLSCELPDSEGYGSRSFTILLNYTLQEIENRVYKNFVKHTSYLNRLETGGIGTLSNPELAKKPNYAVQLKKVKNGYYGPLTSAGYFSKYKS